MLFDNFADAKASKRSVCLQDFCVGCAIALFERAVCPSDQYSAWKSRPTVRSQLGLITG